MFETRQTCKASVEILGQYDFLLSIQSTKEDRAGNPQFRCEVACIDLVQAENERDRICEKLGLACVQWTVPPEALKINFASYEEIDTLARRSRGIKYTEE